MRLPPGRHVFYDFETTGPEPAVDDPIEIAALELIDGQPGRSYTSLIRPVRPVTQTITDLTGITEAMVATAPSPEHVAAELAAFFADSPRVAHNAPFDETVLARLCGDAIAPAPVLDTVELACMVRPDWPSSGLAFLRRSLEVEPREHHRAEADVRMTIDVALALLADLATRPEQLATLLLPLGEGCGWSWGETLRALAAELERERQAQDTDHPAEAAPRPARRERKGELAPIDAEQVAAFFRADEESGRPPRLAVAMPGYEARPQQLEMSELVRRALAEGKHALIEAPTGVGKSLAYLVPLALFARDNGVTVGVSTNTRGLQDQLDRKDLPLLARATVGRPVRWQVVKGRSNYLCRQAWRDQVAGLDAQSGDSERVALAYLGSIISGPGNGEVAQIRSRMRQRFPELAWLAERARASDCSGNGRHERCPTGRVAKRARDAELVILNHALLMTGSQLLPQLDHLVIDEAHALEQRAGGVFSQELSGRELARVTRRLGASLDERGFSRALMNLLARHQAAPLSESHPAQRLAAQARRLELLLCDWERFAGELAHAHRDPDGDYTYVAPEISLAELRPRERRRFGELCERLEQVLYALRRAVDEGLERLAELTTAGKERARQRVVERGLADAKFALYEQLSVLEELGEESQRREVRLLRAHAERPELWSLRVEPLTVANELHDKIFARYRSCIVTSATLALGDRGDYIAHRIGYPSDRERALGLTRLTAPWDSERLAINLVVDDLPPIREVEARARAMAELIAETAGVLGGRTLVLFCAAARMKRTAELARPLLERAGLTLLEQERDGWVRDLLRRMRRDQGTVLFGLQSFWTGVDIAGPALSCVIVERLPFASQRRPVVAARMALEGEGFRGFEHYLLPSALLDLRQGAGRLLRRGDDRGIILLCHEQLSTKAYAARVAEALPGGEGEHVPAAEVGEAVARACRALGIS
jgi:ATP-dependent DNA helicase DinG